MDKSNSRRLQLIESTTRLSANVGKINGDVKYIIYSEENKEQKIEKIKKITKELQDTLDNIYEIAKCLNVKLEK